MRPRTIVIIVVVIGILASVAIGPMTGALSPWGSEPKVKQRLLTLTPLGSSMQTVKNALRSQHWPVVYEKRLHHNLDGYPGVKGQYALGANLGEHFGFPFRVSVDAYWGFDESGKMIDLNVRVIPQGI